jgi:hypothetical protein
MKETDWIANVTEKRLVHLHAQHRNTALQDLVQANKNAHMKSVDGDAKTCAFQVGLGA